MFTFVSTWLNRDIRFFLLFIYLNEPLYMVYKVHHISFYIVNEHNVFDIHVNMVDNSQHKVLCKPEYNKEKMSYPNKFP